MSMALRVLHLEALLFARASDVLHPDGRFGLAQLQDWDDAGYGL